MVRALSFDQRAHCFELWLRMNGSETPYAAKGEADTTRHIFDVGSDEQRSVMMSTRCCEEMAIIAHAFSHHCEVTLRKGVRAELEPY